MAEALGTAIPVQLQPGKDVFLVFLFGKVHSGVMAEVSVNVQKSMTDAEIPSELADLREMLDYMVVAASDGLRPLKPHETRLSRAADELSRLRGEFERAPTPKLGAQLLDAEREHARASVEEAEKRVAAKLFGGGRG